MYLLDVQPFLDLISGNQNVIQRWAATIPLKNVFASSVAIGLAEYSIEALPAGPRAGWRRRLVLAKTEFEPRTFDFTVQDAQVWASDVLPLDLTDTDTDGESYPLDRSVQMISAQALQRRFILVTQARPYHDVLKAQTRLEVFDPGYEEAGA
jgi:predicted nucleic acid-binding protein